MTRGEMIALSNSLMGAEFDSPLAMDPFTVGNPVGGLLDLAADNVCRATDCFYADFTTNLVAGQGSYCAALCYRVKDVDVVDASGNFWPLLVRTPAQMTRAFGANWRTWTSQDPPIYLVWQGDASFVLAPAPAVTRVGALNVEGYALTTSKTSPAVGSEYTVTAGGSGFTVATVTVAPPQGVPWGTAATATATITDGAVTAITPLTPGAGYPLELGPPGVVITGDGTGAAATCRLATAHLWPSPGSPCPIPEDGQMAVVWELCRLRAMQMLGRPDIAAGVRAALAGQMAMFEKEYRRERGTLEANSAKRYPDLRNSFGGRGGFWWF